MSAGAEAVTTGLPVTRRVPGGTSRFSIALLVALVPAVPVLVLVASTMLPLASDDTWKHIRETLLLEYLNNSLRLMLMVACGTLALGVLPAWLITFYRFPGRRVLKWLLICPLAIPAYVMAYVYTGLLDVAGPVQEWLGMVLPAYVPRSFYSPLPAAAVVLSLSLFPYVYMFVRAGLSQQFAGMLEVARILGCGRIGTVLRVVLPLARPGIAAGLLLVLMETLADYGVAQHFGLTVLPTGIFRAWEGFGDLQAAVRLAALLLGLAAVLFILERLSRRQARYHQTAAHTVPRVCLRGVRAALVFAVCMIPAFLGFVLPGITLLGWALVSAAPAGMADALINSCLLALTAALLALGMALLLLPMPGRARPGMGRQAGLLMVRLGYAIPGTVVAISVLVPVLWLEHALDAAWTWVAGRSSSLLLAGGLAVLVYAYLVRFMAVAVQAVEAGLARVRPSLGEVGHCLGLSLSAVVWRIHLPLVQGSLLVALLMVFVEVLRELPATLLLRPFNFSTLAVRAYELAGDGRIAEAAWPALAIVCAALVPVLLLGSMLDRAEDVRS